MNDEKVKYDVDKLKKIPIKRVAQELGIDLSQGTQVLCFRGHDKKTKSLSFNIQKNYFKCFGCEIKGNTISLVKCYFNCSFKEACGWLNDKFCYGISSTLRQNKIFTKKVKLINPTINYEPDIEVYEWIISNTTLSKLGFDYCNKTRGYTPEIIKRFQIKDIVEPKTFLYVLKQEFGLERLIKCGLWKINDSEPKPLWWKHVLLFSFFNQLNHIDYIQGRYINSDKYKYMNLNGVETTIFNMKILNTLKYGDDLIITEGVPDAISLSQKGLNAIGILGSANFKLEYIYILKNYSIYVTPDNDKGGDTFFELIKKYFETIGKRIIKATFNKNYKDVSDFLVTQ
ncbi:MAG: CHC2 zinc finger domain-containing protein [FCB group bacterium]